MPDLEKVIIRRVSEYNPVFISRVIREGIEELGLTGKIGRRITIKPNVVTAHHKVAPSAYTRSEFLDGLFHALRESAENGIRLTVAERSGTGLPSSRMLRRAGYYRLRKLHPVNIQPLEEAKKVRVFLRSGRIHSSIRTAREIVDNDLLVYAPKLKSNVLCQGMTGSVKLNIGILLDRERMWNHNFNLDEKIADCLEVGFPDFIATDAIEIACGGNQMTQHGRQLGAVVMAANPVAHDAVCARILNLDPAQIDHLRLSHERGYGPIDPEHIVLSGDFPLEELQEKTRKIDLGYIPVDQVDSPMHILCGEPYCTGGCHGVFLDWLYMIKDRRPKLWEKLPKWTVVMGRYEGDVDADRLMIIGTCSKIDGKIRARIKRKIKGCPPRHKKLVLGFLFYGRILNPLFRLDLILDAYFFLFLSWLRRLIKGRL